MLAPQEQEQGEKRERETMASLGMGLGLAASGRVLTTRATGRNVGGSVEEKGPLDWIIGVMQKDEQLLETDPILKKVEDKSGSGTGSRRSTTSVSVPSGNGNGKKKFPGFGGLFAKN